MRAPTRLYRGPRDHDARSASRTFRRTRSSSARSSSATTSRRIRVRSVSCFRNHVPPGHNARSTRSTARFAVSGERSKRSLAAARSSTAAPTKNSSVCLAAATMVLRTRPFARRWNTDSNRRSNPPRASESSAVVAEASEPFRARSVAEASHPRRSRSRSSSDVVEPNASFTPKELVRSGNDRRARGVSRAEKPAEFGSDPTANAPGTAPEDARRRCEGLERFSTGFVCSVSVRRDEEARGTAGGRR